MEVSSLEPVATQPVETEYRRIKTSIPAPESIPLLQRLRAVEPRSMQGMPPVVWDRAQGFLVHDPYGNQWIDLTSGIVMANSGHAHPRIVEAIRNQAESELLFTYAFASRKRQELLELLVNLSPYKSGKAILFSAGTEATECSIALMRKHGLAVSPAKLGILSIEGSFHGRTLSARFASGPPGLVDGLDRAAVLHWQLPLPGSAASHGFLDDLARRNIDSDTTAGIILESIPGLTTTPYPQEYIDELMSWAAKHRVVLAVDEVQSGMGRTGKLFAFEHYGIVPDLIACGKGLSSSIPASAVIGRAEIMDLAAPGEMSSTFGGNPVSVAAVLENLKVIQTDRLVERSAAMGRVLRAALNRIASRHRPYVASLDGRGLFYSLHLKDPETQQALVSLCDDVALEAVRRGVMMFVTGRGMIKFSPPLVIEEEALLEAVETVGEVIDQTLALKAAHAI